MDRACCRRRLGGNELTRLSEASDRQAPPTPAAKRLRGTPRAMGASTGGGLSQAAESLDATEETSGLGASSSSTGGPSQPEILHEVADNAGVAELFDGLRRREIVQLLQQALIDLGLGAAQIALEKESAIKIEADGVARVHGAVLGADWDGALDAFKLLGVTGALLSSLQFLVLEQKFLERLARRDASGTAITSWCDDLSTAAFDADSLARAQRARDYLSCESLEELEDTAAWSLEGSREVLWERINTLLPPHLAAVPPRRLSVLLWQAVRYQQLHCLDHDSDPAHSANPVSLLRDYTCEPAPLPTRCIARLSSHSDEVWFVVASHDGRLIASSSKDKTVVLWECNAPGQFKVFHILRGHSYPCSQIAWSRNDQCLLTASIDSTIRLWALDAIDEPLHIYKKHTDAVTSVAWLHDSKRFLSAGLDRCIFLWSVDGSELHRWEIPRPVQDLSITHDGSRMLVVNSDNNLKVIDIMSRREVSSLPESDAVTSICASQLREEVLVNIVHQVASSQHRPVIRLWDLTARCVAQQYFGHSQGRFVVRSCFGGPREEFVISGSEDAQVYIWHKHYGSLLQILQGHSRTVNAVCWAQVPCETGPWLISASDDRSLRVWSASGTQFCAVQEEPAVEEAVRSDMGDQEPEGASDETAGEGEEVQEEDEEDEEEQREVHSEDDYGSDHTAARGGELDNDNASTLGDVPTLLSDVALEVGAAGHEEEDTEGLLS